MNTFTVQNNSLAFVGASEFGLTIALVVFVMITVLFGAFIVGLFVSERFRIFVFREDKKKKRRTKPTEQKQEPRPAQPAKKRRISRDDDDDGVPTIPLEIPPQPAQQREPSIYKNIRAAGAKKMTLSTDVNSEKQKQQNGTFVTRTITPVRTIQPTVPLPDSKKSEKPAGDEGKQPAAKKEATPKTPAKTKK